ncbi:YraN family protein [Ruegeria sp. 2205SS24-7]|uniref:YraN family protein n=1 Tax=Ruegeria discodermiae TaxID=3064389 RepID=UPI0027428318|nr:YraN family protein [Ruegeria sp. 2205SS24-7]MDP5217401.1 YraN family protein [Ruegeria sp. 2205SS24-7]
MAKHDRPDRVRRGYLNHRTGEAAEDRIASTYGDQGFAVIHRRWRGSAGEIDLILRGPGGLIFAEVKQSRDFAHAAASLGSRQMRRIYSAAAEFLATEPSGQNTEVRFDVALVDATGRFQIVENAFGQV